MMTDKETTLKFINEFLEFIQEKDCEWNKKYGKFLDLDNVIKNAKELIGYLEGYSIAK